MQISSAVALLTLSMASTPLVACSCRGLDGFLSGVSSARSIPKTREVFYGRVLRKTGPQEAEVQVLEVFAGQSTGKVLVRTELADKYMCGTNLRPGEEAVFLPDPRGVVGLCSKYEASALVLDRVRRAYSKQRQ